MISFFRYIGDLVVNVLSLWADPALEPFFGGANLLYIFISIWMIFLMVNVLVVHPMNGSGLFSSVKRDSSMRGNDVSNTNDYSNNAK